jgi:uncharacterized protein (DUF433 family)
MYPRLALHQFGKPSRRAYHNHEWAERMKSLGLHPSDTGAPGGKETGERVSHYIIPDGPFAHACGQLLAQGFRFSWQARPAAAEAKKCTRAKFTCAACQNAWAKPDAPPALRDMPRRERRIFTDGAVLKDGLKFVTDARISFTLEREKELKMATLDWSQCAAVESVPDRLRGAWVFRDTRMPVSAVFENIEAGATIDEIIEQFDITREQINAVLEFAARSVEAPPFPITAADSTVDAHSL